MFNAKDYIIRQVGVPLWDDFKLWAFGPEFSEDCYMDMTPTFWNKQHPDNPIYADGDIREDCELMCQLWFEQ